MSETQPSAHIGIIGGSGLYQIDGLTDVQEFYPDTPWGKPSDALIVGSLNGERLAFLPRHGRGHRISPTDLPVRANIYALKMLGVAWVLAVSAVGSMKEEIVPLDLVVPDQIFDRTLGRTNSFFGDSAGIVVHTAFAQPFCETLRPVVFEEASQSGARQVHNGGTYICIEGPQFSTLAESQIYRSWGVDIIGMTAIPEAKLAREAEMHYVTLAAATDYDCWYAGHTSVTVEMVIANLNKNTMRAKQIIANVVQRIGALERESSTNKNFEWRCGCANALQNAIVTDRQLILPQTVQKLGLLLKKYF